MILPAVAEDGSSGQSDETWAEQMLLTGVHMINRDNKWYGIEYIDNFSAVDSRYINFSKNLTPDQYEVDDYDFSNLTITWGINGWDANGIEYVYSPGETSDYPAYYTVTSMKISKTAKTTYGGGYWTDHWPEPTTIPDPYDDPEDGYPYKAGFYHRDYDVVLHENGARYVIHHYLNETTVKVADDEFGVADIDSIVTGAKSGSLYEAYENAEVVSAGNVTISGNASANEIIVYYTSEVPWRNQMLMTGVRVNNNNSNWYGIDYTETIFAIDNRFIPFLTYLESDQYDSENLSEYDFGNLTITWDGIDYVYSPDGNALANDPNRPYYIVTSNDRNIVKTNKSGYSGGYWTESWPEYENITNYSGPGENGYPYKSGYYHRDYFVTLKNLKNFSINFYDEDGRTKLAETQSLRYGQEVVVPDVTPTKAPDGNYTYEFNGWDHEVHPVTGPENYKATYRITGAKYTIHHYLDGTTTKVADDEIGIADINSTVTGEESGSLYEAYENAEVVSAGFVTISENLSDNEIIVYYTMEEIERKEQMLLTTAHIMNANQIWIGIDYTENFSAIDNRLIPFSTLLGDDQYDPETISDYDFSQLTITWGGIEYVYSPDGNPPADDPDRPYYTTEFERLVKVNHTTCTGGYLTDHWPELIDNANWQGPGEDGYPYKLGYYHLDYATRLYSNGKDFSIDFVDEDGETPLAETQILKYGQEVVVPDVTPAKAPDGNYTYEFNGWNPEVHNVTGNQTYTAAYRITGAKYTIHHYLNGTTVKVADDETDIATIDNVINGTKSGSLYEVYENAEVVSAGNITVGETLADNVVIVYYAVPLTVTAADESKAYDGKPLTSDSISVTGVVNGDDPEKFTAVMTDGSTITDVGTKANKIDTVSYNGGAVPVYYDVAKADGTLTVTAKAVTLTANSSSKTYDGSALTDGNFTASALESGDSHTFTVNMTENSTITNVGTQANIIGTVDNVTITGNGTAVGNYNVSIVNGELEIKAKDVTLTANSSNKTYDGSALTDGNFTASALESGDNHEFSVNIPAPVRSSCSSKTAGASSGPFSRNTGILSASRKLSRGWRSTSTFFTALSEKPL